MKNNLLRKMWLLGSMRMDFSLMMWRDCERYHCYTEFVAMTLVLFRSRVIVGPTITGEETNITNQIVRRTVAEPLLCIQLIVCTASRDYLSDAHVRAVSNCSTLTRKQWAAAQRSRIESRALTHGSDREITI